MKTEWILNWLTTLLWAFSYFFAVSIVLREIMVKQFISKSILQQHHKAVMRMRVLGARFDAKAISFIFIPPFLFGCLFILLGFSPTGLNWIWGGYFILFGFAFFSLLIGNIFYFKTYNNHYDIFMFGLVDDDTKAVLKNIYEDYPVVSIICTLLMLTSILVFFICYANAISLFAFDSTLFSIFLFCLELFGLAYFARGSLKTQPLGKVHAQVSSLGIINKMVPNGIIAFSWVLSERKRQIQFQPVDIEEGKQLMSQALNSENLYAKTEQNTYLEQNKPHMVFALMESFSNNILRFDDEKNNDLLGNLRSYFQQGFVFERMMSTENGTAPTLAALYFHSPMQNISQSIAQQTPLKETPFFTYKKQGYRTVFITSGNLMWRNLANYLPIQGVDEIYGENELIDYFPQAKASQSYWGVADEYAFQLAEKLLKESEQPLFINILTMTNHPPYKVPSHYNIKPLNPNLLLNKFGYSTEERLNMLATFQYSSNALGDFIANIEQSELKHKTIISASGDHQTRCVKMDVPQDLFIAYSVPFFLHIPKTIQTHLALAFDNMLISSHKDVMPTLYHLSLSNTEYWHLGGRNLFSSSAKTQYAFAENEFIWGDEQGVVDLTSADFSKYAWNKDNPVLLDKNIPISESEIAQIKAYKKLRHWQINYQVKGTIP